MKHLSSLSLCFLCCCLTSTAWAASYEEQAQRLEVESQWTEARRAWKSELIQHPNNFEARYRLAQLLEKSNHFDDAQALYEDNMQQGWHLATIIALYQRYQAKQQYDRSKALLQKAAKHFRHEATPWYLLADMALQKHDVKQAKINFQQALKADPLNAFAHLRYAEFLVSQRQNSQAIKHAEKSIRLQKTCAPCWRIYGNILKKSNKPHEALTAYQRSLAVKPDAPPTRQAMINVLHQLGDHERAKRMQQALDAWKKSTVDSY